MGEGERIPFSRVRQGFFVASETLVKLAWYQAKFPAPEGAVRDASQVDYRTILATISLSSVRKAEAS